MSGVAGEKIRETRIARATRTEVELLDAAHPDCAEFDPAEGGRWVTLCADHGNFVQHETWKIARSHLGHPEEWCEGCRDLAPAGDDDSTGIFSKEERERALATRRRKADECRAEKAEEEKRTEAKRLEDQWSHWVIHEPMNTTRAYFVVEKEEYEKARAERTSALDAAQRAKRARRQGEEALSALPKVKSRKEKKNRERIEGEIEAADEIVVAKEDVARVAGERISYLARVAAIRGHLARGWKLGVGGHSRPRRFIEKGDRVVWIPDDFLPADGFAAAESQGVAQADIERGEELAREHGWSS